VTSAFTELIRSLVLTLESFELVDLSHTLEEGIPAWPTHARFGQTLYESYELGDVARHYGLSMSEHTGTHIDAPLHFIAEGPAHYGVDEISLDRLVGRAATIETTGLEPGDLLDADHIRSWEQEHGSIETGDKVLFRYGWDERGTVVPRGLARPWRQCGRVSRREGDLVGRLRHPRCGCRWLGGEPCPLCVTWQRGLHRREPQES
jgi:hypothetical protein